MNKQTPLHELHLDAGGKLIDFAGWDMPVQYREGIAAEHQVVRSACGCFDLGHMGRLRVSGAEATAFLEARISRPLASMKPGQVRYGLVCAEDGTVEDDVLVSREGEDAWHIVVNASNCSRILDLWSNHPDAVEVANLSQQQAMIAVQGPTAAGILAKVGLDGTTLRYYQFSDHEWRSCKVRLSRTGYTGEDGFECFLPSDRVAELWQAVIAAGASPCGLGARDTLRLEAGMPLYGNELDREHTPVAAGLGFAVGKKKQFIGSVTLQRELDEGPASRLVGLKLLGKRVARTGYPVLADDASVGQVTSGTLSPTLGYPIAMAYVTAAHAEPGTRLAVDIRGRTQEIAEVVPLPFYRRAKPGP